VINLFAPEEDDIEERLGGKLLKYIINVADGEKK
jgi:hypothetical protein